MRSAEQIALIDALTLKMAHLRSALGMVGGDGFAPFDTLNARDKENYLGMCFGLADECEALALQL